MSDTLFTTETPAAQGSDGAPGITTATTFKLANARTCEGIQFYATATPAGTYTVALWRVTGSDAGAGGTGTLIASKAVSSASITGNAYNIITFAPGDVAGGESLDLDTTHLYRAGVHNGSLYVATNNFFTSALVNGDITGVQDNTDPLSNGWTIRQGTFIIDAALQYPRQVGSSASYFVGPALTVTGTDVNGDASQTVTLAGTVTGQIDRNTSASQTTTLAGTVTGQVDRNTSGSQTASLTGTATGQIDRNTSASQTTSFTGTASATVTTPGASASQTVAFTGTATAKVVHNATAAGALSLDGTATAQPGLPPAPRGNWSSLLSVYRQAAADQQALAVATIRECPNDGEPLEPGRTEGTLHCRAGGEVYDLHGNPVLI